jgi:hypothetical protein
MRIAYYRRWWVRLVLAGFPALFAVDSLLGIAYRTDTNAHVVIIGPRSGATRRAIVVFPGYVMPGGPLSRAFAPYVGDHDALVVLNYAERGVNVSQIFETVMTALDNLQPVELCVYGASMGGMLANGFLNRYLHAGARYGKITLILDSAPASRNNVKRTPVLLDLACWYRGGPVSSAAWAAASTFMAKPPIDDDALPDTVRDAHHAGAWAGTPAVTSQACFIARFAPPVAGELLAVAQHVVYLQGSSPDDDPVVRISDAIAGWRVAFSNLGVITVPGRKGRWHLPLVEAPRATVAAILATPP